jgi:RNA polymerase sigma-70 factor (ECF subfamily)
MQTQVSPELWELAAISVESVNDHELMLLLCASETRWQQDDFFAEFHRRFQARVLAWCLRFTRNHARALDLSQEVFLRAWRHRATFRADSKPTTWLYVIARNHCLSAIQRTASDPLEGGAPIPPRSPDPTLADPSRAIERSEVCREVWGLMSSALEPMEAQVMLLHYGYEVPLAALTRRFALANPSGAKAYIVNGRRKLKGAIARRGNIPASRKSAA